MKAPAETLGRRPWLHSPALDLLVGCGAWSLPLLALTWFLQGRGSAAMGLGFYALGIFCNNPHYMATLHRAYRRRSDFVRYRFFTVYVTALLAATVLIVHAAPALVPWVVTLYLTWSPWHYTGQNFGIAQLFIRRSGAPPDRVARNLLWTSYAASYAGWFVALHARRAEGDANFLSLGLPPGPAGAIEAVLAAVFAGCAFASLGRTARASGLRSIAPAAVLSVTQALWFVAPALLARFGGLELPASYFSAGALAFMHCAQYLWITAFMSRRDRDPGSPSPSFVRYYTGMIVGGIALFVPGPWIASRILGRDFVESFLIFMALVNVHHFILDGAIWKLRDGRIARLLLIGGPPTEPLPGISPGQSPAAQPADPPEAGREVRAGPARAWTAGDSGASGGPGESGSHLGWLFGPARGARRLRFVLAGALLLLGVLDLAQDYLTARIAPEWAPRAAASINPADTRAAFRTAQRLAADGNVPGALAELRGILAINPRSAPARRMLAEMLMRTGDAEGALAEYDRLAALFPQDVVVATDRGVLLQGLGRPADAARRFGEAASLAPDRAELRFLRAGALEAADRLGEARAEYGVYLEMAAGSADEPVGGVGRYIDAAIRLGALDARLGDFSQARTWLQKAADLASTRHLFAQAADALRRLADVQDAAGERDRARNTRALAERAASYTSPARNP